MIDERLENWAKWARDRQVIPVSCKSLECNYKSPQHWEYPELKSEVDILDAIEVEKVLTGATFPRANMAMIVYINIYPYLDLHVALRKINRFRAGLPSIKRHNFDDFERKSMLMIQNRL